MQSALIDNIKISHLLGNITALRDHETSAHSIEVTYLSSILAQKLNLDNTVVQNLMKGAYVHDIGKVGIPDKILLKQASFDDEEWKIMKQHPTLGADLLRDINWYKEAIDVVLYHHEKYDGSGYPYGLKGNNIPYIARIFAIIDVFDALVRIRPYKKAFSLDKAIDIIQKDSETHFDPDIVKVFLPLAKKFYDIITNNTEDQLKQKLIEKRIEIFGI